MELVKCTHFYYLFQSLQVIREHRAFFEKLKMSSLRRPKLQIKPKISVSSPSSSTSSSSPRKNRSISKNNNNSVSTCLSDGNVPALETVDNNSKTNCETNVSSNTAIIVNIDVSESNLETNVLVDHGKKQSGRKKGKLQS